MPAKNEPKVNDFGIKKEARGAWKALCDAQDEHMFWPCKNNPYFYVDYDGQGVERPNRPHSEPHYLTKKEVAGLCADCPMIKECYNFAEANGESHGVWGGVDFGSNWHYLFDIREEEA